LATMGPSSEDDGKLSTRDSGALVPWLQWGRRPKTTERSHPAPRFRQRRCASMGPSSEDDGKYSGPSTSTALDIPSFNGAVVRRRRKAGGQTKATTWIPKASMGPSSEDDGKVKSSRKTLTSHLASMGPSSEDDGKHAFGWGISRMAPGFNGAVVRRRRKVKGRITAAPSGTRFNGAVVRRRRKASATSNMRARPSWASMGPSSEDDGKMCLIEGSAPY